MPIKRLVKRSTARIDAVVLAGLWKSYVYNVIYEAKAS